MTTADDTTVVDQIALLLGTMSTWRVETIETVAGIVNRVRPGMDDPDPVTVLARFEELRGINAATVPDLARYISTRDVDTESPAARQHYIDTGRYLESDR